MEDIGFYFKKINDLMVTRVNAQMKKNGLTFSQVELLMYLLDKNGEPVSPKELEQHFHLSHPTIIGTLQRMERKGLLRCEINPTDRRSRRIILLNKAYEMQKDITDQKQKLDRGFAAHMEEGQLEQLRKLLIIVYDVLLQDTQKIN